MTIANERNPFNEDHNPNQEELELDWPEAEESEPIKDTSSLHTEPVPSKTNGNGVPAKLQGNLTPQQALELVSTLKANLEQGGYLVKSQADEKFRPLEEWAKNLQNGYRASVSLATEKKFKRERQWLSSIASRVRQAENIEALYKTTVSEIRPYLKVDRALIYRFETESQGIVLAEAIETGYTPSQGLSLPAIAFGAENQQEYSQQEVIVLDQIYQKSPSPYQLQLLKQFQVKASLCLPIFLQGQVWGLLVVQQCSGLSRRWREAEISLLTQIVAELKLGLQPLELRARLQKQAEEEKVLAKAIENIRKSTDLSSVFRTSTQEIRRLIKCDRVVVYRFNPDWSGDFVAESVAAGWTSLLLAQAKDDRLQMDQITTSERCVINELILPDADSYLQETRGGSLAKDKQFIQIDDIYTAEFSPCYLETLERYQAKAYVIVPIFQENKLWGMLGAYQNSGARSWVAADIQLLVNIANQFSLAVQKAEYIEQLRIQQQQQAKEAERERLIARIVERILQASDSQSVFQTTVREVRRFLNADRVGVFQFYPDSGYDDGELVAEDVGESYSSAIAAKIHDHCFGNQFADKYYEGRIQAVADIENAGLSDCHIKILSQFQVRANLIVPVRQDNKLWGLLCIHQCSGPRPWQASEIEFAKQIASQFSVAFQKAEYLQQIQAQTLQLAKEADQERLAGKIIERILQTLDSESVFQTTVSEVRRFLNADRVGVFRFYPDSGYDDGEFVAEDVRDGYSSAIAAKIHDHCFGNQFADKYYEGRIQAVADIENAGLSDCHIQVLSQFQVRANLIVPLRQNNKLWGLLCVHQCSAPRQWQASEIEFAKQIASQFSVAFQKAEYLRQIQAQSVQLTRESHREQALARVIDKIRKTLDIDTIFQTAVQEVRTLLGVERMAIYEFRSDYFGDFIYESESGGWPQLVGSGWEDPYLQEHQGGRFREHEALVVDDVYHADLTDCHVEALEYFGVKSCLVVSIFRGQKLWGLLSAFQHSGPRHWQESEVNLVTQVGNQLGVALQQASNLSQMKEQSNLMSKIAETEKAVTKITSKLIRSRSEAQVLSTISRETRQLFKCDRLAVYRFEPDWSGKFIAEEVGKGWIPLVGPGMQTVWPDTYLQETQGGRYRDGESFAVDDIYTIGHSDCHVEILEQFEVKAYLIAPIFIEGNLWGILCSYQNSGPRHWQEYEVNALTQLAVQVGVALQQVYYLKRVELQSEQVHKLAEREANFINLLYKTGQRIAERLQQKSLNASSLFRATSQELRQLLKADRVAVYRFNPDWSGEILIEDVGSGYVKLVGTQEALVADPVLQETKGGVYRKNEARAVNDINDTNDLTFSREQLEEWGARAYVIAPLLKNDKLWGLLMTYQNSQPRNWEEGEVNLLVQMATQFGIILQQSEYLEQIQHQSEKLQEAAEREKADKEVLQQDVIKLLSAVRPALEGDLTVRAPVTDNEVGTIADAYNNTLQSLRHIVNQVQESSRKIAQTSQDSETSIAGLTTQAQQQFQALDLALERIQRMVNSTEAVGSSAQQVEEAVQKANYTVQQGDTAMNLTVDGILEIRETVAETNKRLKRLSESSQKVSKVVNLISNFTTQTQLLALNAAIEATRAGEYGRGFVVVADEVRSLARQSADAATEIAELVQEIQQGTAEVSTVMEKGIQQVAKGTHLVTDARQTLNAIVEATGQISQLVEGITQTTQVQTQEFQSVTQTMNEVAAIADKTSEDSVEISSSFKALLGMIQNLQESADQFKVN
ncbi:GAF domain-containing protein [Lyngbya aestuarii]|uniref:GAF domain-containing protein n=1 Tax=Lyngbya aestuarii TaxID=118322 RepID=UPI00403E091F